MPTIVAGALPAACTPTPLHPPQERPPAGAATRIERSCRLELDDALRADGEGTGALVVATDGVTLERGGINIEHGQGNELRSNTFRRNACGVHLWWDEDRQLHDLPWVRANGDASADEMLIHNRFEGDLVGVQLRGPTAVTLCTNRFSAVAQELDATAEARHDSDDCGDSNYPGNPRVRIDWRGELPGSATPVGARRALAGRDKIQMDEWGPLEPR